jgi:endonuclease-3
VNVLRYETNELKPLKKLNIESFIRLLELSHVKRNAPVISLLASRGATPFAILVSTILSLRTKDEVTREASLRILEKAGTPEAMLSLDLQTIETLIYPVGFYKTKAKNILAISRILAEQYHGEVPGEMDALLALPGVGRKTANLVLVEGFQKEGVCVDTHVHRISNRIGYVNTQTPDETEFALRKKLPRKHWVKFNEYLVAYGQTVCRPVSPFCSQCEAREMCPRKNVTHSR